MNQPMKLTRRMFASIGCAALLTFASIGFATAPAPDSEQRRFEVGFLKSMINHHYGAIKMSELCKGRTVHAELQAFCDSVIAMQSAEIKTMQGWLQSWYGENTEPSLTFLGRIDVERLTRLTGAEFEKLYMIKLIEHHSMAVKTALNCLNMAYHSDMLNMCAGMMAMQGDEIVQLRLWLIQWYGINDPARNDRP